MPGVEHVGSEGRQAVRRGVAEVAVAVGAAGGDAEQVLVAAQRRVVVVLARRVVAASLDVLLVEEERPDLPATGELTGSSRGGHTEQRQDAGEPRVAVLVRARRLVAARG